MSRRRSFNRAWLLAVATVGTVVSMEVGLQLGSLLMGQLFGSRPIVEGEGAVILCVGDSHTYGLPLPVEESYPSQLQVALDERHGAGTFRVVNLGIPSVNSDFVLNRLEREIVQLDPVAVIVWVGINNTWNAVELNVRNQGWASSIRRLTSWSKLARIVSIVFYSETGHVYEGRVRGGWFEGEEAPSGLAAGGPHLPNPGPGLERDLVAMGELARSFETPMLLMAYPLQSQQVINRSVRKAGGRLGVPVIETLRDFARAREDGHMAASLVDLRAGPHPSKLLYGYIVESLLPVLEATLESWYGAPVGRESSS